MAESERLRSLRFRAERETQWRELEGLVDRATKGGVRRLSADELYRLPALYRGVLSSLSVARAISLDRNLLNYLESLATRAYVFVYGSRDGVSFTVGRFFASGFPRLVRSFAGWLAVSASIMLLGVACGWVLTLHQPERFSSFVSPAMAGGRSPLATRDELEEVLRSGGDETTDRLGAFASFLFTHNARIGLACFVLGFAAGVPVLVLLFSNGLALGAFAAIYHAQGLGAEFWGWILPHGITELLAVCLCGAAGLSVGWAVVSPGMLARVDAIAAAGRRAASLAVGTVAMFLFAALIEGFFRQLVVGDVPRVMVATATAVGWWAYFRLAGVRAGDRPA
jgi:uncharacterized membrane protein SpoIIM required for sporulation